MVKNGIAIYYGLGTDEINILGQADEQGIYYAEFAFPADTGSCNVRIKLESSEPEEAPLVYTLTLKKPPQVIMGGGGKLLIPGFSEPYYFNYGEQVIFTAEPEFGTTLTKLYYETDGGIKKEFYLSEAAKTELSLYAFNMPDESLTLYAEMNAVPASTSPVVAYVREGGTGDGSSWENAAGNLQQTIEKFGSSPFTEIWIAGGTIKPDWLWWVDTADNSDDPSWASALNDTERKDKRNWAFVLKDGVKLYGGFRGMETERKLDRLWGANKAETVLSGDVGTEGNAKHVLIAVNVSTPCVLEGLTITGGGTIISSEPAVTIAGKSIQARDGGGLYNENSQTVLRYVTFLQNLGFIGAGMVNYSGSVAAINCRFINNSGNKIFYGNDIPFGTSTNTVFIGTSVSGNTAGSIIETNTGNTCLVNVTMLGNNGGDLYQSGGSVSVYNSIYQTEWGTIAGVDNHVFSGPGTPDSSDIIDMGNDAHYPVQAGGNANTSSSEPGVQTMFNILRDNFSSDPIWRDTEIYRPLLKDLNGKDRFKGGSIDIGEAEDQS
jgi:hypothetical protein